MAYSKTLVTAPVPCIVAQFRFDGAVLLHPNGAVVTGNLLAVTSIIARGAIDRQTIEIHAPNVAGAAWKIDFELSVRRQYAAKDFGPAASGTRRHNPTAADIGVAARGERDDVAGQIRTGVRGVLRPTRKRT